MTRVTELVCLVKGVGGVLCRKWGKQNTPCWTSRILLFEDLELMLTPIGLAGVLSRSAM